MITVSAKVTDSIGTVFTASATANQSSGVTIPMNWNDPRFAGNVAAGSAIGLVSNRDWSENPGYASGEPCFYASDFSSITKCRIDWREGPRLDQANGAAFTVDQCYVNCVGKTSDHADAFQAYSGSRTNANITIKNTCIHAYSDSRAAAIYGSGFVGSTCFFWADYSQGSVTFSNCLLIGGTRMVSINCDAGVTHVNFDHVYFVPDSDTSWTFKSIQDGGTLVIDNWTNVFLATIVNGVIVPGAAIPHP